MSRRPGRPTRAVTVLAALALAGALLAVAAPVWASATLTDPLTGRAAPVTATGTGAAPLVGALALVAAAAAVAVSTARGALLRACAALLALAGAGALAAALAVVLDPAASLAAAAEQVSGTTTAHLGGVSRSAWSLLALLPAAGLVACGAWALVAGRRWSATSRFDRAPAGRPDVVGAVPPGPLARERRVPDGPLDGAPRGPGRSDEAPGTAAPALWDSLSLGTDPTDAHDLTGAPDPTGAPYDRPASSEGPQPTGEASRRAPDVPPGPSGA